MRVNLPTSQLKKSDGTAHQILDKGLKDAREAIVGKMLTTDEFGNSHASKKYSELTSSELHMLVESMSVRLNLFNNKYPSFLPHVVRAILEHPNLANSDRSTLTTFSSLFELDWQGDSALENREQLLMTNPVYTHPLNKQNILDIKEADQNKYNEMIQRAATPFLPDLVTKML